jgi:hypothetical protein
LRCAGERIVPRFNGDSGRDGRANGGEVGRHFKSCGVEILGQLNLIQTECEDYSIIPSGKKFNMAHVVLKANSMRTSRSIGCRMAVAGRWGIISTGKNRPVFLSMTTTTETT